MKIYKSKITGKKITEKRYMLLPDWEQEGYQYVGKNTGDESKDGALLSGVIGYVTNSGIVGGLLGGSLLGGILGDALNDDGDNILF